MIMMIMKKNNIEFNIISYPGTDLGYTFHQVRENYFKKTNVGEEYDYVR